MYMSALASNTRPAGVYLHGVSFSDVDPPSASEKEILKELKEEGLLENFSNLGIDLLHEGNEDAKLVNSKDKLIRGYND
jgi:hypothetical protein